MLLLSHYGVVATMDHFRTALVILVDIVRDVHIHSL